MAYTIRDALVDRFNETQEEAEKVKSRRIYYISMEFLLGRLLKSNLINLGIYEQSRDALAEIGYDLDEIVEYEPDAGLGNGGLGRLAACFLDSLTCLGKPATGARYWMALGVGPVATSFLTQDPQDPKKITESVQWRAKVSRYSV